MATTVLDVLRNKIEEDVSSAQKHLGGGAAKDFAAAERDRNRSAVHAHLVARLDCDVIGQIDMGVEVLGALLHRDGAGHIERALALAEEQQGHQRASFLGSIAA